MPFSENTIQTILMCPPDYYGVDYVINAWMEGQCGKTDQDLAHKQWLGLKAEIEKLAKVEVIAAQPNLPDMVFTANAGLVLGNKAVISRFQAKERQGEEPHFLEWFRAYGFDCIDWPQDIVFEGAGDALWDRVHPVLWIGSGFRSAAAAPAQLEKIFGRRVVPMKLVDPRFYHLDTCMCPLPGGYLMYFPGAFAAESLAEIETLVPADRRIILQESDATKFSCNAVDLNGTVIINGASDALQDALRRAGFNPVITPLGEFLKAGGTAKCLTLKLVEA